MFTTDLGPTSAQLTWITDAFLVPVCLLELTFGALGDLFGRKPLLIIASRGRAASVSIWAAALSFGGTISSVLGGLASKAHFGSDPNAGWRRAYVVVGALALASAAVTVLAAKDSAAPAGRSLDWPGQVTIAMALFALLFAVVQGLTSGWGSAEVVTGFIAAAMFAFLGLAYATSIRLSAIEGFSPLKTSIAFLFLKGMALTTGRATSPGQPHPPAGRTGPRSTTRRWP